jgi:predicted exporter
VTDEGSRRPRGWLSLYLVSFVLMIAAGAVLVLAARDLLRSLTPLWISTGLSAAAIAAAVAGVVLPRRR